MAEPQDITLNPDGTIVNLTWAEEGAASEPSDGRKDTGLILGDMPPPDDWNWPSREVMRWLRAMWSRYPKVSEAMFGSWMPPLDFGIWADVPLSPLDVFLTDSGGVNSVAAQVWVDPDDAGAVRVQVKVPLADPQTLVASRDNYVFVPNTMVAPPTVPRGELAFLDVPIGNPAPPTPAGYVPVWRIETDGTGIVDQEILVQRFPVMKTIGFEQIFGIALQLSGNVDIGGDLEVSGSSTLGDAGQPTTCFGPLSVDMTLDVVGEATLSGDVNLCTGVGTFTLTIGTTAADTMIALAAAAFLAGISATSATGTAISGTGSGAGNGGTFQGGATGKGVAGTGGATSGHGVEGTAQGANSDGVRGTGGNVSTSHGLNGIATNTSAYGVKGSSSAAATTSGAGVRAEGLGSAPALSALAVDGNAGHFTTDTSSPTRSPVVIVGVDSDPSSTQAGAIFLNTSRSKFRMHSGSAYESFHSSPKGQVFGVSSASSGSNITTSADLGDVTISPEQTGDVVVIVTGFWKGAADTTTMAILLKDITGSVTIATSQTLVAQDRDGDGQDRTMPFEYRMTYTLPSAVSRLFRYRLNFSALVNWYDVVLTVQGVY
jgi:hypothetical protein